MYLQSTLTLIRFDTVGGTELAAIHKYAPISSLDILDISNVSPSHSETTKIVFPSHENPPILNFSILENIFLFPFPYKSDLFTFCFGIYRLFCQIVLLTLDLVIYFRNVYGDQTFRKHYGKTMLNF